jgi:hypothetical protein
MRALGLRARSGAGFVRPGSTDSHLIKMDDHRRSRPSLAQVFPGPGPPGGLDRGGAPAHKQAVRLEIAAGFQLLTIKFHNFFSVQILFKFELIL